MLCFNMFLQVMTMCSNIFTMFTWESGVGKFLRCLFNSFWHFKVIIIFICFAEKGFWLNMYFISYVFSYICITCKHRCPTSSVSGMLGLVSFELVFALVLKDTLEIKLLILMALIYCIFWLRIFQCFRFKCLLLLCRLIGKQIARICNLSTWLQYVSYGYFLWLPHSHIVHKNILHSLVLLQCAQYFLIFHSSRRFLHWHFVTSSSLSKTMPQKS